MPRVEVLDQHETKTSIERQVFQQLQDRLQSTRRCTDSNDGAPPLDGSGRSVGSLSRWPPSTRRLRAVWFHSHDFQSAAMHRAHGRATGKSIGRVIFI